MLTNSRAVTHMQMNGFWTKNDTHLPCLAGSHLQIQYLTSFNIMLDFFLQNWEIFPKYFMIIRFPLKKTFYNPFLQVNFHRSQSV